MIEYRKNIIEKGIKLSYRYQNILFYNKIELHKYVLTFELLGRIENFPYNVVIYQIILSHTVIVYIETFENTYVQLNLRC